MGLGFIDQKKPHLFAHRGGNLTNAENSISAFRSAVDFGFKFLETDVIVTKDNKVIAYHGSQNAYMRFKSGLERRKKLQSLTYNEINKLFHKNNDKVPLLEDLLKQFPNTFFSIDAKTEEVVAPLTKVIKRTNSAPRVSVVSFNLRRSLRVSKLIKTEQKTAGLCMYRVQAYPAMLFSRVIFKVLSLLGVGVIHMPYKCVNRRILKNAHKYNLLVYAWTVNSKGDMERLKGLGVDGIISDDIRLLKEVVN